MLTFGLASQIEGVAQTLWVNYTLIIKLNFLVDEVFL
jgi:hypothetical protein